MRVVGIWLMAIGIAVLLLDQLAGLDHTATPLGLGLVIAGAAVTVTSAISARGRD